MNLTILYSCNCYKNYTSDYLKSTPWKDEWKTCQHSIKPMGKWLLALIHNRNPYVAMTEIKKDYYPCRVCGDLFYVPEWEAEMGEVKICSKSCSDKFGN